MCVKRKKDGVTALHMAAHNGKIDVCRYLVEDCGLDVNAMTTDIPRTPLFLAAVGGHLEVCKYIIGKTAKVDEGEQPLFSAAQVYLMISHLLYIV
jgi:ankyrin repeat protein